MVVYGVNLTLRPRIHAGQNAAALLRDTVARCTAPFTRVCTVGWQTPRLHGVELHHQTNEPGRP